MISKMHIIGGYTDQKYTWTHQSCSSEGFFSRATEIFGLPAHDAVSLGQMSHDVPETNFIFESQQVQAFSYLTTLEF